MIYSTHKFVFVHVPRTAGFAIMEALAPYVRRLEAAVIATSLGSSRQGWWTHSRACELKRDIPHWGRLWRWAVARDPWQMAESCWRRVQSHARLIGERPPGTSHAAGQTWRFLYASSKMTFSEWLPWHYQYLEGHGGFWRYYCCAEDGSDLGVEPVMYDRLEQEWPAMAARLGLEPGAALLSRVNESPADEPRPSWSDIDVSLVASLCEDDVRRFGWSPPGPT